MGRGESNIAATSSPRFTEPESDPRPASPLAALDGKLISGARAVYGADGQPTGDLELLVRWPNGTVIETIRFARGEQLAVEFIERYCPGYTDKHGTPHPCVSNALAENHDGLWACAECIAEHHVSRAMKEQSSVRPERLLRNEPHVVYLAADADHIKVGTARSERAHFRLAEQGARAARILGEFPTEQEALRIEGVIHKQLRYADRIDRHARSRGLAKVASSEDLLARLDAAILHDIRPRIRNVIELAKPAEMRSLMFKQPTLSKPAPQSCKNIQENLRVSAKIEAAGSGLLILDDDSKLVAYSLRSLANWHVRVLSEQEQPQQQLGLFDMEGGC
jgi:hypothetical protein